MPTNYRSLPLPQLNNLVHHHLILGRFLRNLLLDLVNRMHQSSRARKDGETTIGQHTSNRLLVLPLPLLSLRPLLSRMKTFLINYRPHLPSISNPLLLQYPPILERQNTTVQLHLSAITTDNGRLLDSWHWKESVVVEREFGNRQLSTLRSLILQKSQSTKRWENGLIWVRPRLKRRTRR